MELDRTVELQQGVDDDRVVEVVASVNADGDLVVFGHDVGRAPTALPGSETYDHWVVVGGENKDLLLLELLRERFLGAHAPTAELMTWLQKRDIRHEVGSRAGEHRGPARLIGRGRRRNGTRRNDPTRAGP
ncbi:MAG: hypothetical protein ACRDKJ_05005 [Actinomycetota bacterium]